MARAHQVLVGAVLLLWEQDVNPVVLRCTKCAALTVEPHATYLVCTECRRRWPWDEVMARFRTWQDAYNFRCDAVLSRWDGA